VKSLRAGRANLKDSFARIQDGEVWLYGAHISAYEEGNRYNHDPERPRKLLLHRREIMRLRGRVEEKGLTLVPLSLYFKRGIVKVELALARGKAEYDKRRAIAERESDREIARALKEVSNR
jgi:SsrA-binding protein